MLMDQVQLIYELPEKLTRDNPNISPKSRRNRFDKTLDKLIAHPLFDAVTELGSVDIPQSHRHSRKPFGIKG